jgi:glyoxylase-like metal-dependent hydrolase (beta-lactamase superfamily II)
MPNNLYLLHDSDARESVVIDPSLNSDEPFAQVQRWQEQGTRLTAIWNTHGHFDHIYDNERWKTRFQVPIWMNSADNFLVEHLREQSIWLGFAPPEVVHADHDITSDDVLRVGRYEAQILHVPGHSPGSVAFWFASENICVSGDVLFRGSVGRTDLPGCSHPQLMQSIQMMHQTLPPDTRILPGHGASTTMGAEWKSNPFLRELQS